MKAIAGVKERVSEARGRRLAAAGVTIGLVTSLAVGAVFDRVEVQEFSDTVTASDLRAEVLEGPAATSKSSAVQYLRGAGYSRSEANRIADEVFDDGSDTSFFARLFGTKSTDAHSSAVQGGGSSDSASKTVAGESATSTTEGTSGTSSASGAGSAGLSKSALLSQLPAFSPVVRAESQGDGSQITSVSAKWLTADDRNDNNLDRLFLAPQTDNLKDVVLQLGYALAGENDYAPGTVRITVPAQVFVTRDNVKDGVQLIPYPESPKKSQDFNYERVGDSYILTNTRTLNAATKGFIQFGLISNPKAHTLVDMSVSGQWQANVEVVTNQGNTLSMKSNALDVQVDTFQTLTGVSYYYNYSSRVSANSIPASQRTAGEDEYVVMNWVVSVNHNGNQPFRLDLTDTIDSTYQGFILEATDSSGRKLEKNVFEGWSSQDPLQFTVRTAYPASLMPCGRNHVVGNTAKIVLTPLDRIDPAQNRQASATATYHYQCPVPTDFAVAGSYGLCKFGNDGVEKNYVYSSSVGANNCTSDSYLVGQYLVALNRLRDGEDVEIDYTINTNATLVRDLYHGDENAGANDIQRRLVENYENSPKTVTLVTTDTGAQLLNETGVKPGTDFEFTSVNISKPSIGKVGSVGLNPDGSFINKYDDHASITAVSDNNTANIPTITLEAKMGANWQKVADVDYSSGSCQVTYTGGTPAGASDTDCTRIVLPAKTTQFRTSTTTNVARIGYTVYPHMVLHATNAMVNMASRSFDNTYTPIRYMHNTATLRATDSQGRNRASIDRWARDELRGFTTDTQVFAEKTARNALSDANYDERYTTIHYTAKVREESFISSRKLWNELVEIGEVTPTTSGVWYDLLPRGVYPVLDTVRMTGGDSVASVRTIDNYRDTGRMLLIVEGNLTPNLENYKVSGDTVNYLRDVHTISFDARIDFDSIIDYGDVLHNVIAFEAGKDAFGSIPGHMGEPDNPAGGNNVQSAQAFKDKDERVALTDVNPAHNNPSFVYAGSEHSLAVLAAGRTSLDKAVMVSNDGVWAKGTYGDDGLYMRTGHMRIVCV